MSNLQKTCHLGDGAYVSFDPDRNAFGFAANDHRKVTVWLEPSEMVFMARYLAQHWPDVAEEMMLAMQHQTGET